MLPAADRSPERADEKTTFAAFYRRELSGQVRRATLIVGDNAAAQDLVHDAFTDVFSRWGSLRDPGPYLSAVVLNRCRDHGRRSAMSDRRLRLLTPPADSDDDLLWDAVQGLPFHHRAVVVLRFYHRMTDAEIAATLDCRPGSVGPWLQRALKRLRKELT